MVALNARSLIGRAVISLVDGEKVGAISGIQFDPAARTVLGLMVGGEGLFHQERPSLIPLEQVHTVGHDAVTIDDASGITTPEGDSHGAATLGAVRKPVMTAGGEVIGQGDDLLYDETSGAITALQLAPQGGFLGIGATTHVLPVEEIAEFGRDVITVHDAARARVLPDGM